MEAAPMGDVTPRRWLRSRWLGGLEMAIVIGFLVADRHHLVPFSNTPFLLALGWLSLRLRGLRWRDVGFIRPPHWGRAITVGVAAGLGFEILAVLGTEPLIARIVGRHPDLSDFRSMVGNVPFLLVMLLLNWTLAAFGEELVYRGWLMNRAADIARGARNAWPASLVAVSVLFGCAHGEGQGLAGIVQEGWNGLLLGILYIACGRRLAEPIIAHGVSNTLAFVLIYLGRYPGV